jgi:hypothetical protein
VLRIMPDPPSREDRLRARVHGVAGRGVRHETHPPVES